MKKVSWLEHVALAAAWFTAATSSGQCRTHQRDVHACRCVPFQVFLCILHAQQAQCLGCKVRSYAQAVSWCYHSCGLCSHSCGRSHHIPTTFKLSVPVYYRLLDDNRQLLVPELQETINPHPHFMLFATQNPPGKASARLWFLTNATSMKSTCTVLLHAWLQCSLGIELLYGVPPSDFLCMGWGICGVAMS